MSVNPLFSPGDLLAGIYEVRGMLGAGGMGQVFEAWDTVLARRVAIKANYPELGRPVRTEAQALAAIRYSGVVTVYAVLEHRGIEFMVMEHVAGVTLESHLAHLERTGVPLAERIELLAAIAESLAAIHRAGISHGDVKLSNVVLSPSGRVVLLDLGLVRPFYQPSESTISGTVAYMAPEVIQASVSEGQWALVDAYAFGVLAFRVLEGRYPFDHESDVTLLLKHVMDPVPALSEGCPPRLAELVRGLLAKDPHDRPVPMDAVVWQLRAAHADLARDERTTRRPLRVLVVDDDDAIRRLVSMYVRQAAPDAQVQEASGADQALSAFRASPPDLVFLDLMMPKMSGFELFTYMRGVHLVDAATVVAMSAGGNEADIALMLELGAHDFIPKGAELRARVQKIVRVLAAPGAS